MQVTSVRIQLPLSLMRLVILLYIVKYIAPPHCYACQQHCYIQITLTRNRVLARVLLSASVSTFTCTTANIVVCIHTVLHTGRGAFTSANSICVNGTTLTFKKAVLATGGSAALPLIDGLKSSPYLTNSSIFNLTQLPKRMVVIGAGAVGMELAQGRLHTTITI
jgi:Pyridine nucleotide-disulphide oxidoreductase